MPPITHLRIGRIFTAGAATLAFGVGASAGPVNKSWIAADATWYVHVDSEAAIGSTLGQFVVNNRGRLGLEGMDGLRDLGIDPFKDVKSVTIYDTDDNPEHAIVIASTTSAVEQLIDLLKSDPATRTMSVDGHTLVAFDDKGKTQYWHTRPGEAPDTRIVFISDDWKIVTDALKVVDGATSSLSRSGPGSPLAGDPGSGSIVYIRAAEIPSAVKNNPDPNASALLGQVGGVQLDLGERDGEIYGLAQLYTSSGEDAANISQVAQGLLALGKMLAKNNQELAPISNVLNAMKIEPQDRQRKLSFSYQSKKVIEAVESMLASKEKADAADRDKVQKETRP